MIFTSYFSNMKNLPFSVYPIAISLYQPKTWIYPVYKRLAPSSIILKDYKENQDKDAYTKNFKNQILSKLNPESVVREIMNLCPEGKTPCLICYEKSDDFCHRHLVADWFNSHGYKCEEFRICD